MLDKRHEWTAQIADASDTRYKSIMAAREGLIAVYMMASRRHGTLYIGVTSDLAYRAWQHREGALPGFTKRYGCTRLVWYEPHESIVVAIQREKSLKRWPRAWKTNLIERDNPYWDDLYGALVDPILPTTLTDDSQPPPPIIPSS